MEKCIIVRYCEIHLKGKNRGYFEKLLQTNIQNALSGISHKLKVMHSRYLIENYNEDEYNLIVEKLKKVAGVHTISPAMVVDSDYGAIKEVAFELCKDRSGTFKVETNRADKTFPLDSMLVSRNLGGDILENFPDLKVDVKNPSFVVNVDIREDGKTFVYNEIIRCLSGMPVGSAGRGLLLISGGIDSPVAGYLTCKRGMKVDCLHFHSFPYTGEAAKQKVIDLTKRIGDFNGGINLYIVSFTHIQEAIHKNCPEEFMITLMRRFMMRIAERLAKRLGDQAIITGESLGQVASQTIESITSSNSVVENLPVLRPLIMFDKLDIIEISKKIDTYDISVLPYEDCCTVFLPKFPAIKPNLEKVIQAESRLNVEELIAEALDNIERISL